MFDFPTTPPVGTVVTLPDGSYRVWDGVKWGAAPSYPPPVGPFLPLAGGIVSGSLGVQGAFNPAGPITSALLINAANDAAAAGVGVQVGQWYRNGSQIMQRAN